MMIIKSYDRILPAFLFILLFITAAVSRGLAAPSADELLKRKGFVWKSAVSENLRLHFEPGTLAETRLEGLKLTQEKAFVRNLQLLKITSYSLQTDIFIVDSRARMKQLIGDETNGVAFPRKKVLCFVFSDKINASGAHELMHVMAGNTWGFEFKTWINEGFAAYADDFWYGYGLHDLNKYLLQEKQLISLEKLIKNFNAQPHMISYPQAGSFVKYLYEQYGADKVKELWKAGAVNDFQRILGKDVSTIEKEWHTRLMQADAAKIKYDFFPRR
jgi:hypothetical protein